MARFGRGYRAFDVREAAREYEARSVKRASTPETTKQPVRDTGTVQQDEREGRQHDERNDR